MAYVVAEKLSSSIFVIKPIDSANGWGIIMDGTEISLTPTCG